MTDKTITDDRLNLFIDEQLDDSEMDEIRQRLLHDSALRERVCQFKAVRELVHYAYERVPGEDRQMSKEPKRSFRFIYRSLAASVLLMLGVALGWFGHDTHRSMMPVASVDSVFQYFKHNVVADNSERRIILHVTTGDIAAVNNALNEAELLLASYRAAGKPMRLDIVTFKEGINMLRVGVSPYIARIEDILAHNDNVNLYACYRSVEKARSREGKDLKFMPQTVTAKTAQELISERIEQGWIYIKV